MLWRLLAVAALLWTGAALAATGDVSKLACHAVAAPGAPPPAPEAFSCRGEPVRYDQSRLWLRLPVASGDPDAAEATTLLVHQSRFDRLLARFEYEDGHVFEQEVTAGNFGSRWRIGGQIALTSPAREVRLTNVQLAVDRLESFPHFRARILPAAQAANENSLIATVVGAAIALLTLSTLYNGLLALGSRRAFIGWHAAWVATILVWGLLWSQLALLLLPGLAGTLSARLCTFFSTLAISLATACAVSAVGRECLPRWARWTVLACGGLVGLFGLAAAFPPAGMLPALGSILSLLVLADLAGVVILLAWGWRIGDKAVRDFTLSWSVPMAALASTEFVDYGPTLLGGGSQLVVLLACAFQTVWISVAETFRLARLRVERDAAHAARREMQQLAERDSLTGLLNRRGFVERAQRVLRDDRSGFALLLIDVDHFKAVNDRFGHDVGDAVLRCVALCVEEKAGGGAFAGRLGGEEFAIGLSGPGRNPIKAASAIREAIEALPLAHLFGETRGVTVSIGVSRPPTACDFETIYREADRALYAAKNAGRNQVALFDGSQAAVRPPRRVDAAA